MHRWLLLALLTIAPLAAQADTIKIPIGSQGNAQIARPTLGMSMAEVERRFGEPLEKQAPVGNPPITRWVYAEFVVYFEHTHVIDSVLRRHPAQSGKAQSR